MPATITPLRTRADRLKRAQATMLREALDAFEAEMPDAVCRLRAHIDRLTVGRRGWRYLMVGPEQNYAVVEWLASHSSRPVIALRLWALLFQHVDYDTGAIALRRDELAGLLGATVNDISRVMGELAGIGAVLRHRSRVPGMRGPGAVTYFLNPLVGTHLAGAARDDAQTAAPRLQLVP